MTTSPAMESIFANAQQNAASLIETATLAINAKVNTIEEAENMIQELSTEAVMFNELLTTIMNAMRQVESGDMQKEEAAGIIAPAVKELKEKCTALKIANADAPGDDITEDEIAILRELIIGAKAAAEDRLVAIRLGDDDKTDPEVEAELEDAEEGFISNFIARRKAKKVDDARVNVYYNDIKDLQSVKILNKFAKAAATLYEGSNPSSVSSYINEMIKADNNSKKYYTDKLYAKDYIIKSYGGIELAIMPGNVDGTGLNHILMPHGEKDVSHVFPKDACRILLQPVKKDETSAVQEACEVYDQYLAMEASFLAAEYLNNSNTKTAKALYSNAKKLYSLGEKDKALGYMKKAKALYEKALSALLKSGKFEKAEITKNNTYAKTSVRTTAIKTDSMTMSVARASLEHKIDRCTAHIIHWTTKAGKEDYQEILNNLKTEREQAKAAKKATKATENYEKEYMSMTIFNTVNESYEKEFNYDEFMFACEAYMDELECALEADEEGAEASAIASKIRSAFSKLKRANKSGDEEAAKDAQKEADAAMKELADAEQSAPEEKKAPYKKALKTAAVAAGSVAAAIGLTVAGKAIYKKATGKDVDPMALVKTAGSITKQAVQTTGNKISEGYDRIAANRDASKKVKEEKESMQQNIQNIAPGLSKHQQNARVKSAMGIRKADYAQIEYNKRRASRAGEKVAEAFGISAFDAYELILEALNDTENDNFDLYEDTDEGLANAIEMML